MGWFLFHVSFIEPWLMPNGLAAMRHRIPNSAGDREQAGWSTPFPKSEQRIGKGETDDKRMERFPDRCLNRDDIRSVPLSLDLDTGNLGVGEEGGQWNVEEANLLD